jgi:peptidyl-prolyl cis-trans isomerase D
MLQAIRGQAASWIVKALFVVLIFSFVAWGVADYIARSRTPTSVATVGSRSIDPTALSNAVSQESQRLRQIFGSNLERDQLRQLGVVDQVLNRLIGQTLVELEAQRLGVTIDDAVVRSAIQQNPAFRNEQGQFDRSRFQLVLNQAGFTEASFVALLRQDLLRSQLMTAVASGAHPPAILVSTLVKHRGERRVVDFATVPLPGVEAVAAPTDDQLAAFHKDHAPDYTAPEYRDLSWTRLAADDLESSMQPSEDQIKDFYDAHSEEFVQPETRTVEQILLNDEATAKTTADSLAKGEDFAKVAAAAGTSADQLVLGTVKRDDLPPDIADAVFGATLNQPTQPVKSDFGWHIFRITAITPESTRTLADAHDEIAKGLAHDKAADAVYEQANKLEDMVSGGTSLEDAAQQLGLKLEKAAGVDAQGHTADGTAVTLPNAEAVLKTAFGLNEGQTSSMIETRGADEYVVIRADHVTPPVLKPLDTVKSQVETDWVNDQREQQAKANADKLVETLKGGTSFADVAKSAGLTVQTSDPFTRNGDGIGTLPASLASGVFAAKATGEVSEAPTGMAGVIIAQLKEIQPVSDDDAKKLTDQVTQQLKQGLQADLSQDFQEVLRKRYSVSIDRKAVDQLF